MLMPPQNNNWKPIGYAFTIRFLGKYKIRKHCCKVIERYASWRGYAQIERLDSYLESRWKACELQAREYTKDKKTYRTSSSERIVGITRIIRERGKSIRVFVMLTRKALGKESIGHSRMPFIRPKHY